MTTEFHKAQSAIADAADVCNRILSPAHSQPQDLTEVADLIRLAIRSLSEALPYYRGPYHGRGRSPSSPALFG